MYNSTTKFNQEMEKLGGRTFRVKLESANLNLSSEIKKITFNGGSNDSGNISIGTTLSQYIEVEMANISNLITNIEFKVSVGVVYADNSTEYIPMGYFKADRPKKQSDLIKFKAYDRMLLADKPFSTELTYPTTTVAIMNEVKRITGLNFATTIDSITVNKPENVESNVVLVGYTCRDVIGFVSALYGQFATIDRQGNLIFKWYEDNGYKVKLSRCYSMDNGEDEYHVDRIACNNGGQTELVIGGGKAGFSIVNPLMTQPLLNSIYIKLKAFTFRTATIKLLGDCRLDSWDIVTVETLTGTYKMPLMVIKQFIDGGLTTTITSRANESDEFDTSVRGSISKALDRTQAELLVVNTILADKVSTGYLEANYIKSDQLDTISANIQQATIGEADLRYATIDSLNASNGRIDTLETNSLTSESAIIKDLQANSLTSESAIIKDLQANSLTSESAIIKSLQTDKLSVADAELKYATIGNLNASNGRITTLETESLKSTDAELKYATITNLNATNAEITNIKNDYLTTKNANITYATISSLNAEKGRIDDLSANKLDANSAIILDLQTNTLRANSAEITSLQTEVADINTLIFGSATGETIQTEFANAVIAQLGNASIKNAMIDTVNADKINSGTINTNNVNIRSSDGSMVLQGSLQQFKDEDGNVRIQLGKDAQGNYTFLITDGLGATVMSANGITEKAVPDGLIVNSMVADNANISGDKLDINSVVTEINNGEKVIKSNKIKFDETNQTLDIVLAQQKSTLEELQNVAYGKIETYQISHVPTLTNYPAMEWTDMYVKDDYGLESDEGIPFRYTEEEYQKHLGTTCYIEGTTDSYRFTYSNGEYGWMLIENSEYAVLETKIADVKLSVDGLTTEFGTMSQKVSANSTELATVNSRIEQSANGILQTVNSTYATKTALNSTVSTLNSNIEQMANSITSSVESTYSTKEELKATNGNITSIEDRVSKAEEKITDDAIIRTVSTTVNTAKTEAIKSANDNMATQLENYTNTNDMNNAIADAKTEAISGANDETDKKLKSYSTTEQMNTAIEQSATAITSSVSSTYSTKEELQSATESITDLTTRMSSAEEKITDKSIIQTVSEVYSTKTEAEGYANAAQNNANNETDKKLKSYSTTTQMNSAIEQTAKEIKLSISEITVGGNNYLLNTNRGTEGWLWVVENGDYSISEVEELGVKAALFSCASISTGYQVLCYTDIAVKRLVNGQKYTISFDILPNSEYQMDISYRLGNSTNVSCEFGTKTLEANVWNKVELTGTFNDNNLENGVIYIQLDKKIGTFVIANINLEEGTKATSWSPAIEDMVSNNNILSSINMTKEEIKIESSKIDFNGLVTANEYFKILTDGSFVANKGVIGGITIENNTLTTRGGGFKILTDGSFEANQGLVGGWKTTSTSIYDNTSTNNKCGLNKYNATYQYPAFWAGGTSVNGRDARLKILHDGTIDIKDTRNVTPIRLTYVYNSTGTMNSELGAFNLHFARINTNGDINSKASIGYDDTFEANGYVAVDEYRFNGSLTNQVLRGFLCGSGNIQANIKGTTWKTIQFPQTFKHTPKVFLQHTTETWTENLIVRNVTTTSFEVGIYSASGGGHTSNFNYIAFDMGV